MSRPVPVYRVFLASSPIDLEDHRREVSDALTRISGVPATVEAVGAATTDPVQRCCQRAREADAVVVFHAWRYGWVPTEAEGGNGWKSAAWMEVEAALQARVPVFAFLVDPEHPWPAGRGQATGPPSAATRGVEELRAFLSGGDFAGRDTFTTPSDLARRVSGQVTTWVRDACGQGRSPRRRTDLLRQEYRAVQPLTSPPHFAGREDLLGELWAWYEDTGSKERIRAIVGEDGMGRTALLHTFLKRVQSSPLKGSVLFWSFAESHNTGAFLREVCDLFLGERDAPSGGLLARLERGHAAGGIPHLLVLDGLETLQSDGHAGRSLGELEDVQLRNLLRFLAAGLGRTRALVTARHPLTDLLNWDRSGYRSHALGELELWHTRNILRGWGVKGSERALDALATSAGRHALTVSLLGSFLTCFHGGDPLAAPRLDVATSGADTRLARLHRLLVAYAGRMPETERDFMSRIAAFPRGVSASVLGHVIQTGSRVAGLLSGLDWNRLARVADRLVERGLLYSYSQRGETWYTLHPMVREFFLKLLKVRVQDVHEAVRSRMGRSLEKKPTRKPQDPATLDRYEALVEHTRLAGAETEAFQLYHTGMGGCENLLYALGDYDRGARVVSGFADRGDPKWVTPALRHYDRGFLANEWGVYLTVLGDLARARRCFRAALEYLAEARDSSPTSTILGNLSGIACWEGAFPLARALAQEALALGGTREATSGAYVRLAAAAHELGDMPSARNHFSRATALEESSLDTAHGMWETQHLLDLGQVDDARAQALGCLEKCRSSICNDRVALSHALLGRIAVFQDTARARTHLAQVWDWVARTGDILATLEAHRLSSEISLASHDLVSARTEALTGLHLADSCGFGWIAMDLQILLARIHLAIPDPAEALNRAHAALHRAQHPDCKYAWGEADAAHLSGLAHLGLDEPEKAWRHFSEALEVRRRLGHPGVEDTLRAMEGLEPPAAEG